MFLTNKYTKWYYNIINSAKARVVVDQYLEKHHIVPKSMGGSNNNSNLVKLTAREHFICHVLLAKMTSGLDKKKMIHAVWCFIRSSKNQQRIKISSRQYEKIRKELSQTLSAARKGMNTGKIVSAETRNKLSLASKGRPKSDNTKEKMKLAWETRDRNVKSETRNKLSISSAEFWANRENRQQQSLNRKNYLTHNPDILAQQVNNLNAKKYTCECCGKETNKGNYSRWHGNNCKEIKHV